MQNQTSRRDLLRAALPALAASPALGGQAAKPKGVRLGFVTNEFRDWSNATVAKEFSSHGVKLIQLFLTQTDSNYWKYNGRSELTGLTPERCREIAGIYRSAGITIHSIGVYTNLVHPDPAERKANLAYFEAMMKVGEVMGVRRFITETGHYYQGPAQRVAHDLQEEVWSTLVSTGKELAQLAAAHDVMVLFEPYFIGALTSAKRTRAFLEEVGSPSIRVNLDPSNLLELNDLDEMFHHLQPWIESLHAKDHKPHVYRGVAAGGGELDYPKLVRMVAERTPNAPLVLEYATSKTWLPALAHVRSAIKQAGLVEL